MTNYFAGDEIFYQLFFLPAKFYADFSDKVMLIDNGKVIVDEILTIITQWGEC